MLNISNKSLYKYVSLGFDYRSIMCYTAGNTYVLCDMNQWPIGRGQTTIPKKLERIRRVEFTFENQRKVINIPKKLKNVSTKTFIDILLDNKIDLLFNIFNNESAETWTDKNSEELKLKIEFNIGNSFNNLYNEQLNNSKYTYPIHELRIKKLHKQKAFVYNSETGLLTLKLGKYKIKTNEKEYLPSINMINVDYISINLGIKEIDLKSTDFDRLLTVKQFMDIKLPNIINDSEIRGDRTSITALSEKEFMEDNLIEIAKKLNIKVKDNEQIMFRWTTLGDKIVEKLLSEYYPDSLKSNREFKEIISNKNMTKTLINMNLIQEKNLTKKTYHKWGSIYEALIYMAERNEQYEIRDMLVKKLVKTFRNW